jgi:hypothetical protein
MKPDTNKALSPHKRLRILHIMQAWLETPMVILAFCWLGLLILEFTRGLESRVIIYHLALFRNVP